jgi:hypothetical protein
MIRELTVWISETLFYLTNGVMLIETPWLLAWAMFWSVMMAMPLIYVSSIRPSKWRVALPLMILFPLLIFFSFITAIGPGIVQQQMMVECKDITVSVNTELVGDVDIDVQQCRTKENFYGDFGEWKLVTG